MKCETSQPVNKYKIGKRVEESDKSDSDKYEISKSPRVNRRRKLNGWRTAIK